MKNESLKELREAYERMTASVNDERTTLAEMRNEMRLALDKIKAAMYIETPAPAGRFKLEEFLADDPIRPVMCGVFHDGGFKVGCDSHILAAVREDYDTENDGKIIGKDGRSIEGKYPNWRSVIPGGESQKIEIDTAKVYGLLKREKAENKLAGGRGVPQVAIVRVGDAYFKASFLAKVCKFMDHYGIKAMRVYGPRHAAKATAEDGSVSIIMPVVTTMLPYQDGDYLTSRDEEIGKAWGDEHFKFLRLSF
jgi:hypothetical protein